MIEWGPAPGAITWVPLVSSVKGLQPVLAATRRLSRETGVPVQVVRGDRVLSEVHLVMAAEHARRGRAAGRVRADDPALAFLLFAALDRQIHRALVALGLPPGGASELVVVGLGARDPEGFRSSALACLQARHGELGSVDAHAWWAGRLGVSHEVTPGVLETVLLERMALLALDKV